MPRVGPDLLFWVGRGDQRLVDIVRDLIQQPSLSVQVSPTIARPTRAPSIRHLTVPRLS